MTESLARHLGDVAKRHVVGSFEDGVVREAP